MYLFSILIHKLLEIYEFGKIFDKIGNLTDIDINFKYKNSKKEKALLKGLELPTIQYDKAIINF